MRGRLARPESAGVMRRSTAAANTNRAAERSGLRPPDQTRRPIQNGMRIRMYTRHSNWIASNAVAKMEGWLKDAGVSDQTAASAGFAPSSS